MEVGHVRAGTHGFGESLEHVGKVWRERTVTKDFRAFG